MKKNFTLHNTVFKIFCALVLVVFFVSGSNAQSVTITSPAAGTVYAIGSSVSASATTSGFTHTISNVTFTLGALAPLEDPTGPTYTESFSTSTLTGGTYNLTATATDTHGNTASKTISITIVGIPTTTSGATCGGTTATLTASGGLPAGGTYSWYTASSGGTAFLTSTSATSTYTPTISTTQTYYVSYKIGSVESARTPVTATLNSAATSSFTVAGTVNVGAATTLTYTGSDPATSTFSLNLNGGTIVSGSGKGPYSVSWASPGTYNVTLTVTNVGGCTSSTTGVVTVAPVTFAAYGFSKAIVLNTSSAGISSTLASFPALVYIKDNALIILNNCGDKVQFPLGNGPLSGGGSSPAGTNYDFAFTLPGSSTELNYQVENYDSAHGILLAWVQVPSVTNVNTNLTFYFGSLTPTHTAATAEATWTGDYLAVYHFNDTPVSTTTSVQDETSRNVNGTPTNITTATDEIHSITGTLGGTGGGYNFVQANGSKILTNTKADITGAFTLSAWVYVTTPTGDNKVVSNELNFGPGYKLSVKNGVIETETRSTNDHDSFGNLGDKGYLGDGGTVSASQWHYIQGVFTGTTFINYLDGVPVTTTFYNDTPNAIDPLPGGDLTIGVDHGNATVFGFALSDADFFGGTMDEVRVSNVIKSADWIACEYYNQSNPVTFTNNNAGITAYQPNASNLVGAETYTWIGGTSTDPTVAANWDIGLTPVFNGNTKLSIPVVSSGNYPVLNADESIYELTIANGASFNLGGHTLNVGCNIFNSATTAGTGILNASSLASGINWDGSISTQTYTGTNNPTTAEVGNMTVNNSSAGTITITGGPVDLFNQLTLTKGNLVISNAGNGALTLKSTSTQTAAVGIIPSAYSIQGIVNVERFITGGGFLTNRGYRMLSSPVNQVQYASGATNTNTFGLFYLNNHVFGGVTYQGVFTPGPGGTSNGFSVANNNATIYLYNEALAYNNQSFTLGNNVPVNSITSTITGTGSTSITTSVETISTTTNVSIPVGNGFSMYFVGPTFAGRTDATTATPPADATITANGYLNQGNFAVKLWTGASTLSYTTPDASHPYPGYNMVGNPYACTIDLHQLITDNVGNINNVYLLSSLHSPNQYYLAYTANGNSAPPAQGYAVSGEGFLVRATGAGKTLTFYESEKVPAVQLTGPSTIMALRPNQVSTPGISEGETSRNLVEPQGNILTGLYMELVKDSATYNYCGIYFSKAWSDKYAEDDARDMDAASGVVVMSSLSSDSIRLAVNHMPDYSKGINVKLYVSANADGPYNLKIAGITNIDTLYDIYLIDHYTQDSLNIRKYGSYAFNILLNDTMSYKGNRFELSIHPGQLPLYKLLTFTGQKVAGGVQVNWKTEGAGDYTGFVLQKADGTTFNPIYSKQSDSSDTYTYVDPNPVLGNNTYRLQRADIAGNISYSLPVTIIYNTSAITGALSIYPNPTKATINVNVASATSQIPSYKANIYNSVGQLMMQKSVSSNNWTQDVTQYTPGTYIIQMTDSSGNLVGKSKFVKTN